MTEQLLDDKICKALDVAKDRVKDRDKDFVCLVEGGEGNGKSSLGLEMARYMDPAFDVDEQVCMDHEQVIRTADKLQPYQAIVFDEGIEALLSRNHGKSKNKTMIEWFREVRAKNLFIFICMPEFKEIEKPIRDDRAHALVKCVKQGWAHFFNQRKMNEITVTREGNRVRADYPKPLFRASWKDPEGSSFWKRYQSLKTENVENLAEKYLDDDEDKGTDWESKYRRLRMKTAKTFVKHLGMSQNKAAEAVGVSSAAYTKWKQQKNLSNIPPFDVGDAVN